MACGLEFRELASRNPFVVDLEEQGYLLDLVNGYLVIYGIPYLGEDGTLQHGDWLSGLDLADGVIDPPRDHQAWFRGGSPHDGQGRALRLGGGVAEVEVAKGFVTNRSFSYKLADNGQMRAYASFEEKVTTYLDTITAPAMAKFEHATPQRAIERMAVEQGSPLKFPDTLSARYNINDISALLREKRVAIVGLGGTGSYILDFVARTHLKEIALFDDDKVHVHTIFRQPGFIHRAIGRLKIDALAGQYGNWHAGIRGVAERITAENVEQLSGFDFVFVSVDDGPTRILVADWLSANGIPFVDCGMGLNRSVVGLNGFMRITGVDRAAFDQTANTRFLPGQNVELGEYRKQAQIGELNALNAVLAVLRFKQHFGMLDRLDDAVSYTFETASFDLDREPAK